MTTPGGEVARPSDVANFHRQSDVNSSTLAQHHTLGIASNQASPGDHAHDGKNSKILYPAITVSGAHGGNVALQNLLNALAEHGLIINNTTA